MDELFDKIKLWNIDEIIKQTGDVEPLPFSLKDKEAYSATINALSIFVNLTLGEKKFKRLRWCVPRIG